jgi:hypothetical protein
MPLKSPRASCFGYSGNAPVLHAERGGGLGQGVDARFAIHARVVPAIEPDRLTVTIGDPRDVQAGVEYERAP